MAADLFHFLFVFGSFIYLFIIINVFFANAVPARGTLNVLVSPSVVTFYYQSWSAFVDRNWPVSVIGLSDANILPVS